MIAGGDLAAAGLTVQEAAILRLVAGEYSNKEVARHLGIAVGTVKNHISDILRKLDARDRTHAVLKAIAGHLLWKEESPEDWVSCHSLRASPWLCHAPR